MRIKVLAGSMLVAAAMLGSSACGGCSAKSGSTCSSSFTGVGDDGGGSDKPSAFVFAADTDGKIDGYTLSTGGGSLAATSGYTAPTVPSNSGGAGMVVAQNQYLFTSYAVTGQIFGWSISSSGDLTPVGNPFSAPYLIGSAAGGEQSMIANPAGTLLFVLDPGGDAVYVYQIGSGGVLSEAAGSPLILPFTPENLAIDGLGNYLYVSNSVSGSATTAIAAYAIGSGSSLGSLTAVQGSPFTSIGSSLEYSMHQLQGDPSGKYLIGTTASATGDDHLYVFNIQQAGLNAGAITPATNSPFATKYSPVAIAVQPSNGGDLVYSFSIGSTGSYNPIEGYQLNTSTGALSALSDSPFTSLPTGGWGQFDPSGAFLFVYDSAATQLTPLEVASDGALTQPISAITTVDGYWAASDPN